MISRPRIVRAQPSGAPTRAEWAIPVIVTIHWQQGGEEQVNAVATAWTREAVEVVWSTPGGETSVDWVPAADVRRVK